MNRALISLRITGRGVSLVFSSLTLVFWAFVYGPYLLWYFAPLIASDTTAYYAAVELLLTGRSYEVRDLAIDLPMGVPYLLWFFNALGLGHFWYILIQTLVLHLSFGLLAAVIGRYSLLLGLMTWALTAVYLLNPDVIFTSTAILTETYYTASLVLVLACFFGAITAPEGERRRRWFLLLGAATTLPLLFRGNGIYMFVVVPAFLWLWGFNPMKGIDFWKGLVACTLIWLIAGLVVLGYPNYGNLNRVIKITERVTKDSKHIPAKESAIGAPHMDERETSVLERMNWYLFESWSKVAQGNLAAKVKPFYNTYLQFLIADSYLRPENRLLQGEYHGSMRLMPSKHLMALEYQHRLSSSRDEQYWRNAYERLNPNAPQSPWLAVHMLLYEVLHRGDGVLRNKWVPCLWIALSIALLFLWLRQRGSPVLNLAMFVNAIHFGGLVLVSVVHGRVVVRYMLVSQFAFYILLAIMVYCLFEKLYVQVDKYRV